MLRVRFRANEDDYRPIDWPVRHPYWCTGYGPHYSTVVSYADNLEYILENWPEATEITVEECDGYTFTDRFPRPEWFKDNNG